MSSNDLKFCFCAAMAEALRTPFAGRASCGASRRCACLSRCPTVMSGLRAGIQFVEALKDQPSAPGGASAEPRRSKAYRDASLHLGGYYQAGVTELTSVRCREHSHSSETKSRCFFWLAGVVGDPSWLGTRISGFALCRI